MGADASQFVGRVVTMQNDHGKYLQYTGSDFNHSTNQAAWEQWTIEAAQTSSDRKVTHVYLNNAAHDVRLSASDNKKSLTGSKNRAGWEKWQLESAGDRFYLKSAHGTYLNQGSDGRALQSNNKGGSELWRLTAVGGPPPAAAPAPAPSAPTGRFYLTNGHSQQMQFSDTHVLGVSANRAAWEVITLESKDGKTVLCGAHGRNLQVDGTTVTVSANKSGWEQFTLNPAGGGKWYIVAHTGNHLGHDGRAFYCNNRNTGGWEQWTLTPA